MTEVADLDLGDVDAEPISLNMQGRTLHIHLSNFPTITPDDVETFESLEDHQLAEDTIAVVYDGEVVGYKIRNFLEHDHVDIGRGLKDKVVVDAPEY